MIARIAGAFSAPSRRSQTGSDPGFTSARSQSTDLDRTARSGVLWFVAFAVLIAASAWRAQLSILNHDSGWYLQATRILLDGGRLYQDIIEINPPLAFFLHVPPVWLAGLTGASPVVMFFLWVFVLVGVSFVLCHRVINGLALTTSQRTGLLAVALVGLILGSWQGLGQREHFLMTFVLPYLFLAVVRATNGQVDRRTGFALGAFAAFGFALKPHFVLVPLVIEGYLWLAGRRSVQRRSVPWVRAETVALAALLVAYGAFVAIATPLYFTRIVPWALAVYGSYSAPLGRMLAHPETILLPPAVLFYLWVRRPGALRAAAEIFLLTAVCFWVVYLAQSKGFSYHRFPVRTALIVGLGACLLAALDAARPRDLAGKLRRGVPVAAIGLLLAFYLGWLTLVGGYQNIFLHAGGRTIMQAQATSGAKSLYVFSSNVWQAFPVANYTGLRSVSRYPTQWLLPGIVHKEAIADGRMAPSERRELQVIKQFVLNTVIEDFRNGAPDLVLVDMRSKKPYFGGIPFDYLAYFMRDARFAAIWSNYRPAGSFFGFEFYRRQH